MRLVTVAHGTRHATGNGVAFAVTEAAGARLGVPHVTSFVELSEPRYANVIAGSSEPTVVVPLLLSRGYHIGHDVPAPAGLAPAQVLVAGPLGPDSLLAAAQVDRLLAAGARPGQPVVLIAAGSTDPAATRDLTASAELLAALWCAPVRLATLAGRGPRAADVVRRGDAVSPYLLAPGHFAALAARLAWAARAAAVAEPIGPHPLLIDLIVQRANALLPAPSQRHIDVRTVHTVHTGRGTGIAERE
jgi:sirohydrochlorin ferrochelatase